MSSLSRYKEINQSSKINIAGQAMLCDNGCDLKIGYKEIKKIILVNDTGGQPDNQQKVFYIKFKDDNKIDKNNDTYIEWNGSDLKGFRKNKFLFKGNIFFYASKR